MTDRRSFFSELKRRNVLRAAVLYIGATWALAQGISQLTPALGLPEWITRWFLIAALIGFPFWIAFAWFYEFTPQGLKRESEVAPDDSLAQSTARKLDFAIIGVLAIAVVLLASGYFVRRQASSTGLDGTADVAFDPPKDSLVVLPFKNLNGDSKQQYFSDGITEELTGALGQNPALRVIAWDTASTLRDATLSAGDVGKRLNVANVLHGSIERENGHVRVLAELVNTRTGMQVWASQYDDSLANIFAVQDKISAAIADALKVKFATTDAPRSVNPQAHDLVLQAIALKEKARTAAPLERARTLLQQAVALDSDYAEAHSQLAVVWGGLTQYSTLPLKDALSHARAEADQALALDPHNVTALMALGNIESSTGNPAKARAYFERALTIDPSNASAHLDESTVLPLKQAMAQSQEAVLLDPDNATAQNNLVVSEQDLGDYRQALAPALAMIKLDPHSADSALGLAGIYALLHRNADAVKAFDLAQPDAPLAKALVAAGRLTYQSLLDPKLHARALTAVQALRTRADLDPISTGDVIQLLLVLGQSDVALALLPQNCAADPIACSDISVNPFFLPLHNDPRFAALVKKYDTVSQPAMTAASSL